MKRQDLLFITISGFLLVVVWLGFNIYHNIVTSTIPEATSIQIAPIPKNFDTETVDAIKRREKITPIFDLQTTKTPIATESGEFIATSSGETP